MAIKIILIKNFYAKKREKITFQPLGFVQIYQKNCKNSVNKNSFKQIDKTLST